MSGVLHNAGRRVRSLFRWARPTKAGCAWAWILGGLNLLLLFGFGSLAHANDLTEYRLKAAFVYNFALFTEWPSEVGSTLNLCIVGQDPFGKEIDELNGKAAGARTIAVLRKAGNESVAGCQLIFIAPSAMAGLPRILEAVRDKPVLTVADSPGAARLGVIVNMAVVQEKITFEANLRSARSARLNLSSKLLRLATEVHQ